MAGVGNPLGGMVPDVLGGVGNPFSKKLWTCPAKSTGGQSCYFLIGGGVLKIA